MGDPTGLLFLGEAPVRAGVSRVGAVMSGHIPDVHFVDDGIAGIESSPGIPSPVEAVPRNHGPGITLVVVLRDGDPRIGIADEQVGVVVMLGTFWSPKPIGIDLPGKASQTTGGPDTVPVPGHGNLFPRVSVIAREQHQINPGGMGCKQAEGGSTLGEGGSQRQVAIEGIDIGEGAVAPASYHSRGCQDGTGHQVQQECQSGQRREFAGEVRRFN